MGIVLFVRCWTSWGRILVDGNASCATAFRNRRRLLLCLLSQDCFRLFFRRLGTLSLSSPSPSPSPLGSSMFPVAFQPFRRGQASSAEPGTGGCGRRGRCNGGGGGVVGIVGRMGRSLELFFNRAALFYVSSPLTEGRGK